MVKKRSATSARGSSTDALNLFIMLPRWFAWSVIALTTAFLVNNYLTYWRDWPGAAAFLDGGGGAWSLLQAALYGLAVAASAAYVMNSRDRLLRPDTETIFAITAFIIRACFWAVFLIGLVDMVISFLRVEGLLPVLFGEKLAIDLGRSTFRGVWLHFPMLGLGILLAIWHRGLGFPWLALLVVAAEFLIVLTRFIFSYEQAFMADLVRLWYAALFLFASAYTLLEEGHVRVDVLYSGFDERTKGLVNAAGSVLLGISLCSIIMYFGMSGKSTVINGPLLVFETTPTGFGMYVKYWMAGFLGIFAVSMQIQFAGYFLEGMADYSGEPGKRELESQGILET